MKKLNNYFFDEDHIHVYDALWFYGTYIIAISITSGIIISIL